MKKQSVILFFAGTVLAALIILGGVYFLQSHIGKIEFTEETLLGSIDEAEGLKAGFRADGSDALHWKASFDYSCKETQSSFKRGEMKTKEETSVYDDFRFTGWSSVPYTTLLKNDMLGGLQSKDIQRYYDDMKKKTVGGEDSLTGKIRLSEYLDYYPVSYRFQFGTKIYNSDDALLGLKILEGGSGKGGETPGYRESAYDEEVELYGDMNRFFRIPVIENEYQTYEAAEGEVQTEASEGAEEDFYRFDPVIVVQEENLMDGKRWEHPDLAGGASYEKDDDYVGKNAEEYNLKNRLLLLANNRTAKGKRVDFSQIEGGYGIYELPVEAGATATVRHGRRSETVPDPKPLSGELSMVYSLDEEAEYVEMSLSGDHRCLALFFVEDSQYYVELVDADTWTRVGCFKMFEASEKLTYSWGKDGSLAAANHRGKIAAFCRSEKEPQGYKAVYCGEAPEGFDEAFFSSEMASREKSYAAYQCNRDDGLAIAEKKGKVAFAQNPPAGEEESRARDASLECAVIGESGTLYWGKLHSNIIDSELKKDIENKLKKEQKGLMEQRIIPVGSENWVEWKE